MRRFPHYMYARILVAVLFLAPVALHWIQWWHIVVGNNMFLVPPRLLLYISIFAALVIAFHARYYLKDSVWRRIILVLLLAPLSLPFDIFWRRVFGDANNLLLLWSPPHLMFLGSLLASFIMLLSILRQDQNSQAQRLFGGMALAGAIDIGLIVAIPFFPIGPYQVFGFFGAAVVAFVYSVGVLVANRRVPGFASSTITAILLALLANFAAEQEPFLGLSVVPYIQAPVWLLSFSLLVPAIINDLVNKKLPFFLRGLVVGALWGAILFGFSSFFFPFELKYTLGQAIQAIVASGVGGVLAALMLIIFQTEKVIYKYSV